MKQILKLCLVILCFVIVPAFFCREIAWEYYSQKQQAQLETVRENMEKSIEPIAANHEDKRFFHAFFLNRLRTIDNSNEPLKNLKRFQHNLFESFPKSFAFIVWQKNGDVDRELSQVDGYRYLLKTTFKILKQIKKSVEDKKLEPETIIVAKTMTLLRGFFGQVLLEKNLRRFFQNEYTGQAATVSEKDEGRLFWAYLGNNFSAGILINSNILGRRAGPKIISTRNNCRNDLIKIGYFAPLARKYFGTPHIESERREILLETKKFEEFSQDFKESRNFLLLFRKVSPDLVAFSYARKAQATIAPTIEANKVVFLVFKWLIIILFPICVFSLRKEKWGIRIKSRILLIFFVTNGLPAIILITTSYSFFTQKSSVMIFDQHQKSLNILRELDNRYLAQNEKLASLLNDVITSLNKQYGERPWPKSVIDKLKAKIDEQKPGSYLVIDKDSNDILEKNFKQRLIKMFLLETLFSVENNLAEFQKRYAAMAPGSFASEFGQQAFWQITNNFGNIALQSFGLDHGYSYANLLGKEDRTANWALVVIRWGKSEFLESFIKTNLSKFANETKPRIVGVVDAGSERIYTDAAGIPENLLEICRSVNIKKTVTKNNFAIGEKRYLLSVISSNNAQDAVFFSLYPMHLIADEIVSLKSRIAVMLAIVLTLLFAMGYFFSNLLMNPVGDLQKGLNKVNDNAFDFELSYKMNDELGKLVQLFNSAIKSLKDLTFGTTVQESLLAGNEIRSDKVKLFAKSLFMTKMGGDYFDHFEVDKERLVLFFGDVAGHGIPAAVLMAMVKASITYCAKNYETPAHLLQKVSRVFNFMNSRKLRRMMTCCCLELNLNTGEFIFANAGQCFPLIISNDGQNITELKLVGYPLGATLKKLHKESSGKLLPGESIIFYTDGLIEGMTDNNELLDVERFKKLVKKSWAGDLEENWEKIIKEYKHCCREQADDLTMLMLKYCG